MNTYIICSDPRKARRIASTKHWGASRILSDVKTTRAVKLGAEDRLVIIDNDAVVREVYEELVRAGRKTGVNVAELFVSRVWS